MAIKLGQGLLGSPLGGKGGGGSCTASTALALCSSRLEPKSSPEGCYNCTSKHLKNSLFFKIFYIIIKPYLSTIFHACSATKIKSNSGI